MINDEKIQELMLDLEKKAHHFNSYVKKIGNQCAYTDRKIEETLSCAKNIISLYEGQFNTPKQFNHIRDCWAYLHESTNYKDLCDRIDSLPQWSGEWTIDVDEDNRCIVRNDYFDKQTDSFESDEEVLDVEFNSLEGDEDYDL